MGIMKKKLEEKKSRWSDELPGVLWLYRTNAKTSTGETLFALAYGSKTVIPREIRAHTARIKWNSEDINNNELRHNLDAVDEMRD